MFHYSKKIKNLMTLMALAVGAVILSLAPEAYAAKLRLSDGVNPSIVVDDESADDSASPLLGEITYVNLGYGGLSLTVNSGSSKPSIGSDLLPEMHMTLGFSGTGSLTLEFTDTDFLANPNFSGFLTSVGGSFGKNGGTYEFSTYLDDGNAEFGQGTLLATTGPLVASGGSLPGLDIVSNLVSQNAPGDPYSLTLVATITSQGGAGSIDADLVHTPEPGTFLMLGMGLIGIVGYRRNKMKSTQSV